MANNIYHKSNWGSPEKDGWGDVYFNPSATNKLYVRSDNYENEEGTDKALDKKPDTQSILMTPTAYNIGSMNSILPTNGDGDFTFARTSTATRVNKDGLIEEVATDTPRLDYPLIDGVVQDSPALLLEPSRTNLFLYSKSLESGWLVGGTDAPTFTASQFTSPDGGQNASRLQFPSTGTISIFQQLFSHTSGQKYTISAYVKSNVSTNQEFKLFGDYGTPSGISSVLTATSEWQRFTFTYTATATGNRSGGFYYVPNTESDLQIYGIQLEAGSYATSYIPTAGSSVTRSAETCDSAGTSAEFNDSEGVLYAEIAALVNTDDNNRTICIDDSSENANNAVRIRYRTNTNQIQVIVRDGGVVKSSITTTLNDITTFSKCAFKYKSGDNQFWIDGFKVNTNSASHTITGLNTLSFQNGTNAKYFYGKSKEVAVFKEALTDSELEALTSWDSFTDMATGQEYTIR